MNECQEFAFSYWTQNVLKSRTLQWEKGFDHLTKGVWLGGRRDVVEPENRSLWLADAEF
jgi:hypothetical protein